MESTSPSIVLSYADAARTIRAHALLLTARSDNVETLPLLEALGRILAAPVIADRDQPPFARSARDGFACKTADLARSEDLLVVGQLRAGEVWTGPALEPGQVIEIMTGAPVPDGADCVLMVEHAAVNGKRIRRSKQLAAGENIVPAGTEAKTGSVVIPAGTRISPHHIAAAAGFGYSTLVTFARPRVAILATGDELVPVNVEPLQHQIRNSNSYSLAARVLEQRAKPILFPIVHDDLTVIEAAIADAIACDLLILSGGVSMGKYDFVEQALLNLGAELFFTGVLIQPGRPAVFGRLPTARGHRYFFGLPGNPVSTIVTFALFASPLLSALAGESSPGIGPRFAEARLADGVAAKSSLTRFLPAFLESDAEHAWVRLIPWQGSGDQTAAAKANCFIVVPEGNENLSHGATVRVLFP